MGVSRRQISQHRVGNKSVTSDSSAYEVGHLKSPELYNDAAAVDVSNARRRTLLRHQRIFCCTQFSLHPAPDDSASLGLARQEPVQARNFPYRPAIAHGEVWPGQNTLR